ncbi:MAG: YebC/PmpR family DNA-binding transcriptional regulator, partial [Pseudomonadota bacterium]
MSGHSKWHNIQHKKGLADAKRGKMFSKAIKEISVAVRKSGPDVDNNPRLRLALDNARGVNMPKDTIERAIKKAAGVGGENYVEETFEAYGPSGEAYFVESLTDNKTRTVGNVRAYLNKHGGNLGKDGCLQFVFERKGIFTIALEKLKEKQLDEDNFTLELIDAGAEDVESADGFMTISTA